MWSGSCYDHGRHLFKRYANSIDWDVLTAYLMMAGCVGPVRSFWEAYWRGWDVLLARSSSTEPPIQCILENLVFFHLMDSDSRSGVDGDSDAYFQSYQEDTTINVLSLKRKAYLVDYGPTLDSLKKMLEYQHPEANNLSMLLIRGCEFWSHSTNYSNSLTVLEISSLPTPISPMDIGIISELTRLESLNFSHLPGLETMPDHLFSKLTQLRWLIVRGCSKLRSLPSIDGLTNLVVLDLSHCTGLHYPVFLDIRYPHLQVLDLSCTPIVCGFRELSTPVLTHLSLRGSNLKNPLIFNKIPCLVELDLSGTKVKHLPSFTCLTSLQNLSLRGLQLETLSSLPIQLLQLDLTGMGKLPDVSNLVNLKKLILADCQQMDVVPSLKSWKRLTELDLSRSSVEKLPNMSKLPWLEKLFLADCRQLKVVPDLKACKMLTELDLSGLQIRSMEDFNLDFLKSHWRLKILNLSRSSVEKLPDLSGLENLEKLILADCPRLNVVPDLSPLFNLTTLDLSLPDDSSIDSQQIKVGTHGQWDRGSFPLPRSLRKLVLTNRSGLQELFRNNILSELEVLDLRGTDVVDCDSILEAPVESSTEIHVVYGTKSHQALEVDHFNGVSRELDALISDIQNHMATINTDDHQAFKMQRLQNLLRDLRYIRVNMDGIKNNSRNSRRSLLELKDAATDLSLARFSVDSAAFKLLSRLVVKLKGLVPDTRNQEDDSEAFQITKKKKSSLRRSTNKENIDIVIAKQVPGMVSNLDISYNSLSYLEKQCLLCFSVFPFNEDDGKNTCALKSLEIRKKMLIYWWAGEGFIVPKNANKHTKGVESIEEIGKQIVEVLAKNNFIEPVISKGRESASYYSMRPFVHSFVIERAKEERFFDIDRETCNLTPNFHDSHRACLLKPQDKFRSSCELWARHVNSPQKLASFEHVKTLFNVNESMLDIKREWFSKMQNLKVLRLGSWGSENAELVEVNDQKFLEDLEGMKQLRLLSLQGLPTIMKIPDSVCHLTNLIILDLKECSYLEELPADIGSLKSLTHLDISNCPLLHQVPKGISFLSKLEVLKGIVINRQHISRSSSLHRNGSTLSCWWEKIKKKKKNEECTFRDLLKLERLRELSLVVKITNFPENEDLNVLNQMEQLRKLKILWVKNIDAEVPGRQSSSTGLNSNIEKLELWCFPHENVPDWLTPWGLKNLNKLYIVGGHLKELTSGPVHSKWNVETLRLKHLQKLDVQWDALMDKFPKLKYVEMRNCDRLTTFPCDEEGVWKSTS